MADIDKIRVQHLRNENGDIPTKDDLLHGEIAIGYKKGSEAIHIKNSAEEIVSFYPPASAIVKTTYANLVSLKNNSKLVVGTYYRITDFVTTVANDDEARSDGHPFDVIVLATDVNVLQEEAFAALHEGDVYFKDCKLESWKVWYCLDNDITRFAWADNINGKGVIYRLIDEWQNDCPYDFKNVQFKRYKVEDISPNAELASLDGTYCGYNGEMQGLLINDKEDYIWAYTFSLSDRQSTPIDASIVGYNNVEVGEGYGYKGYYGDNVIKPTTSSVINDDEINSVFCLNNIVWWTNNPTYRSLINGNRIESECFNMTLSGHGTVIGHDCRYFVMGDNCMENTFGNGCTSNSFGNSCNNNKFGDNCINNKFGDHCYNNISSNLFSANSFKGWCYYNSFGEGCISNTFGEYFEYNSLGGYCSSNIFKYGCGDNSFGNDCRSNSFGNYCSYNSFGNDCSNNKFGDNFRYNTVGNDVRFIKVLGEKVYHVNILNGTKGVDISKPLEITFETNKDYCQFAGLDSNGKLQIWVDADIASNNIINTTYSELKSLRDNSKLIPGKYYRITDFVTTVANDSEARSAGHAFDVIVLASNVNTLREEASAALHENDTYFEGCQLGVWKIWYCLDNDITRFLWADTENGKGVIYRLVDEWQNDCPYDFKNVQFKRYAVEDNSVNGILASLDSQYYGYNGELYKLTIFDREDFKWAYTFTLIDEDGKWVDYSSKRLNGTEDDLTYFAQIKKGRCEYNLIRHFYGAISIDDIYYQVQSLNNIVLISTIHSGLPGEMSSNTFGISNYNMTLKGDPEQNHFGDDCYNNIVDSYNNSFGNGCYGNLFGKSVYWNSFGNDCCLNIVGNYCYNNTFGNACMGNSLISNCFFNSFGDYCYNNTFGNACEQNSFGIGCMGNTFGNNCYLNSFGIACVGNTFEERFQNNTLGNNVEYIKVLEQKVRHTNILNGTKGNSSNAPLIITFETEKNYCQFAGLNSKGKLQIWVDANLIETIQNNKSEIQKELSGLEQSLVFMTAEEGKSLFNEIFK